MHILLPWIDTQINFASKSVANDVELTRAKSKVMAKRFGSLFEEYSKVRNKQLRKRTCVFASKFFLQFAFVF